MIWVPCACDCKLVCVFAWCTVMSICKFTRSWHVLSALSRRLQGVCVFAWYTVMSICKFYSIMTCLSALCLQLQGGLCLCWEHSLVNLYVLLNHDMSECPVPAIVRSSVSLLGAQSCQFVSSAQSWNVLRALWLRLQGGLCLCWVHSHVNF